MPFSSSVREAALVAGGRCCSICHKFAGRSIEVHHIVQEANGGANTIENAIPLCFDCHAEAGHYNPRHPLGTKYSPAELRRHRDDWFKVCAASSKAMSCLRSDSIVLPPECAEFETIELEVGTLWSHLANEPVCRETIQFQGAKLAEYEQESACVTKDWWELYLVRHGRFLVYHRRMERGDICRANLSGSYGDMKYPLTLEGLQEEYPELATKAGLQRIRVLPV